MDIKTQWIECRHEDGRPRDIEKCNAYRVRWGMKPLPQPVNVTPPALDHKRIPHPSRPPGPGTHLAHLLKSIGIVPKVDCGCELVMDEMDTHGLAYCRSNREKLLQKMRDTAGRYSWGETLFASWKAVTSGVAWAAGVSDPIGGLYDEACRRFEAGEPLA